jgi:hypothetical protein
MVQVHLEDQVVEEQIKVLMVEQELQEQEILHQYLLLKETMVVFLMGQLLLELVVEVEQMLQVQTHQEELEEQVDQE